MNILIILHGILPSPNLVVTGSGLRAYSLGLGLKEMGHDIHFATRKCDMEDSHEIDGFSLHLFEPDLGKMGVMKVIERVKPDVCLLIQLEEALNIPNEDIPIIIDLYAPRLLESRFQKGLFDKEASTLFLAIERGDFFLCTGERQKYFYLNLLTVAGVDINLSPDCIGIVPLSPIKPFKKGHKDEEPLFVYGGIPWPWQNPSWGLRVCADFLNESGRGMLDIYTGEFPIKSDARDFIDLKKELEGLERVRFFPLLPYDELLLRYSGAWGAIDVLKRNYERELSISFRELDYLTCGVPLLTSPWTEMARYVKRYGAGFLVDFQDEKGMRDALTSIIEGKGKRMSRGISKLLSDNFTPVKAIMGLLPYIEKPFKRIKGRTARASILEKASLSERLQKSNIEMEGRIKSLEEAIVKKDSEIHILNEEIKKAIDSINALSLSISKEISFKKDAIRYLGLELEEEGKKATDMRRELPILKRDLRKKGKEIEELTRTREELKEIIKEREQEKSSLIQLLEKERAEILTCRGVIKRLEEEKKELLHSVRDLKEERDKKNFEIETLNATIREKEGIEKRLIALNEVIVSKDNELSICKEEIEKKNIEVNELTSRLNEGFLKMKRMESLLEAFQNKEKELDILKEDVKKKDQELKNLYEKTIPQLKKEISELQGHLSNLNKVLNERDMEILNYRKEIEELEKKLALLSSEVIVLKGDIDKKNREIEKFVEEMAEKKGLEEEARTLKETISKLKREIRILRADIRKKSVEIEGMADIIEGKTEEIKHLQELLKKRS